MRDNRGSLPRCFYCIRFRFATLTSGSEMRKKYLQLLRRHDITITYHSSAILRVQSLCNESLLRVSLRLHFSPGILLLFQRYELSARTTRSRKGICVSIGFNIRISLGINIRKVLKRDDIKLRTALTNTFLN